MIEEKCINEITQKNSEIDKAALSANMRSKELYKLIPHLSIWICNELSKNHSDMISSSVVEKIIWMFRKLSYFMKQYFNESSVYNKGQEEYNDEFPDVFFPFPMKHADENAYN